jgi:hypothetical protein
MSVNCARQVENNHKRKGSARRSNREWEKTAKKKEERELIMPRAG